MVPLSNDVEKSKTKCNTMFFFNNFTDIFTSARVKTVLRKNTLCVYDFWFIVEIYNDNCLKNPGFFFNDFNLYFAMISYSAFVKLFYMSTFYKQSWFWRRFLFRIHIHRSLHYHYARFYVNHFTCMSAQIILEPNWNMDLRTLNSKWK